MRKQAIWRNSGSTRTLKTIVLERTCLYSRRNNELYAQAGLKFYINDQLIRFLRDGLCRNANNSHNVSRNDTILISLQRTIFSAVAETRGRESAKPPDNG